MTIEGMGCNNNRGERVAMTGRGGAMMSEKKVLQ